MLWPETKEWFRQLTLIACCCVSLSAGAETSSGEIRISSGVPPGFEALTEKQTTQADVYYGGIFLMSTFVTFDLTDVEIQDPIAVVEAIPNVRDPEKLASTLTGPLPNNSAHRCSSRVISDCGKINPEVAAVIFDDATYRLDLFIGPGELMVHELAHQRYLPPPTAEQSTLHNIRMSVAGLGSDQRFTLGSESFIAWQHSRIRARYNFSDEGVTLNEVSWQRDNHDFEYEIGSYRTTARELAFGGDLTILGARFGTSTKTRTDLLQASATPVFLFLDERSQVNVFRGNELIDSRFLDAGNHELDTRNYPDGAYELRIETTGLSGSENVQSQFFVRSHNIPPQGEPQYFIEGGTLMSTDHVGAPQFEGGAWLRGGASHRIAHHLSLDSEVVYADKRGIVQSGLFYLSERAQVYGGAMVSTDGDFGYLLRTTYHKESFTAFVDIRQVFVAEDFHDDTVLLRRSYLQGSASLAFPLYKGRMFIRASVNQQEFGGRHGLGVSYLGPLFDRWGFRADMRLDAHVSDTDNWIKAGVTFRRINASDSIVLSPSLRNSELDGFGGDFNGYWNGSHHWEPIGDFRRSTYINHGDDRTSFGTRLMPRSLPGSDLELGVQRRDDTQIYYALNNSLSVVTTPGQVTLGDGGTSAGAVVIDIKGGVDGQFEVRVDNRIVGYAWANKANVISLRPYETYRVRVNPISDNIVGFDESVHEITVYPGNVEVLEFEAFEITVLVGQAVDEMGVPLKFARFHNTIGLGLTDSDGWFQIEVKDRASLVAEKKDGTHCQITLPQLVVEQNLAVLDVLVCRTIPAQRLAAE